MAVTVYFGNTKGTIPNGANFRDCPSFDGCLAVIDGEGKTVAIVSIASMLFIGIDTADSDRKPDDATASPSAD